MTFWWVGGTGNWSSASEWASSSGGSGGAGVPGPGDNVVFDTNSFSANNQISTVDTDFTINNLTINVGETYTGLRLAFSASSDLSVNGNVDFNNSFVNFEIANSIDLIGTNKTITTNGLDAFDTGVGFSISGSYTLVGDTKANLISLGGNSSISLDTHTLSTFDFIGDATVETAADLFLQNGTLELTGESFNFEYVTVNNGNGFVRASVALTTSELVLGNNTIDNLTIVSLSTVFSLAYAINIRCVLLEDEASARIKNLNLQSYTADQNRVTTTVLETVRIDNVTIGFWGLLVVNGDNVSIGTADIDGGELRVTRDCHLGELTLRGSTALESTLSINPGSEFYLEQIIPLYSTAPVIKSSTADTRATIKHIGNPFTIDSAEITDVYLETVSSVYAPNSTLDNSSGFTVSEMPDNREKRAILKISSTENDNYYDCELVGDISSSDSLFAERMQVKIAVDVSTFDERESLPLFSRTKLIVFDKEGPDGITKFDGFLMSFEKDYETNTYTLELFSHSDQLNNLIFQEPGVADYDNTQLLGFIEKIPIGPVVNISHIAGAFETGSSTTEISRVLLIFENPQVFGAGTASFTATATLHTTLADAQNVASSGIASANSLVVASQIANAWFDFGSVTVSPSQTYYIRCDVSNKLSGPLESYGDSAGSTRAYTYNPSTETWTGVSNTELQIKTLTLTGNTDFSISDTDIGEILRNIIESQKTSGGLVEYSFLSIPDTGVFAQTQFSTQTAAEAIAQCMRILGQQYVFSVDSSTNLAHLVYVDETEASHTVTIGEGVGAFSAKKSGELIVSDLYFTGGDTGGGNNLFIKYQNETTRTIYQRRESSYVDGRITIAATADEVSDKVLSVGAEINVVVALRLFDSSVSTNGYDLESFKIGQIIKVENADNATGSSLYDVANFDEDYFDYNTSNLTTLKLSARSIVYNLNYIDITLVSVSAAQNQILQKLRRDIEQKQVEDNPTAPS